MEQDIEDLKRAKNLVDFKMPGCTKLFLDNLHYTITERDLERYFGRYGHILDLYIVRSRLTKLSRGYGYVEYSHEHMAEDAMADADDEPHMVRGRYITTQFAYGHRRGRGGPRCKPY